MARRSLLSACLSSFSTERAWHSASTLCLCSGSGGSGCSSGSSSGGSSSSSRTRRRIRKRRKRRSSSSVSVRVCVVSRRTAKHERQNRQVGRHYDRLTDRQTGRTEQQSRGRHYDRLTGRQAEQSKSREADRRPTENPRLRVGTCSRLAVSHLLFSTIS